MDARPIKVDDTSHESLPALVDRAAQMLGSARSAAEVLEAREMAGAVYDLARRQARIARAKRAHDEVLAAVHRAQADALEIEAQAKRRLADEYDAAQERGEVAGHGGGRNFKVPNGNVEPSASDLGLSRKDIHEARQIRDAEETDPGIIKRTLARVVEEGKEPTRAALRCATDIITGAMVVARESGRRSNRMPGHIDDPTFKAMARVTSCCRDIIEVRSRMPIAQLFSGFGNASLREQGLSEIRECHDLLTEILEAADG